MRPGEAAELLRDRAWEEQRRGNLAAASAFWDAAILVDMIE